MVTVKSLWGSLRLRGRRPGGSHDSKESLRACPFCSTGCTGCLDSLLPRHQNTGSPSELRLARFMKCRQRLGPCRGSSAAPRRARRPGASDRVVIASIIAASGSPNTVPRQC